MTALFVRNSAAERYLGVSRHPVEDDRTVPPQLRPSEGTKDRPPHGSMARWVHRIEGLRELGVRTQAAHGPVVREYGCTE